MRMGGRKSRFFEVWMPWGDFFKDAYEAKLFGMHIGSVLSGLYAGM